jgi:uncharacterized protein (TIGR01777 family)
VRVLVSGASGFVGSQLVPALCARGDEVIAISRNPERTAAALGLERAVDWSGMSAVIDEGVDAVIHLAGETVQGRWNKAKAVAVRESRIRTTDAIATAIVSATKPPSVLLSASGIGFYGEGGETTLEESAPAGDDFFAEVCVDWEGAAMAASESGCRVAMLRFGIIVGEGGGAIDAMLLPTKLGVAGPLGSGRQWWSWIHRSDVVRSILFVLDNSALSGPVNVVAQEPIRQAEFQKSLSRVLKRPSFMPAPAFALRAVLGTFAQEVLSSKRVIPRALSDAGFTWEWSDLGSALADATQA